MRRFSRTGMMLSVLLSVAAIVWMSHLVDRLHRQQAQGRERRTLEQFSLQELAKDPSAATREHKREEEANKRPGTATPIARFALFALYRSGSHWLQRLLESHPVGLKLDRLPLQKREIAPEKLAVEAALDNLFGPLGFDGFVLLNEYRGFPDLFPILKAKDISVIFLRREDHLASFISLHSQLELLSRDPTIRWTCEEEACKERANSVLLRNHNPQQVFKWCKQRELEQKRQRRLLQRENLRYIEVTYDELMSNTKATLCEVFRFLGLQECWFDHDGVRERKVHDKPKSEYFDNWPEIVEAFRDTSFGWMVGVEEAPNKKKK
ncbi:hypothetical protein QOT17_006166 [Balamuthia mandrillaris]